MSTEDALRDALDQVQQVEKLMEAMRSCPDKAQAICNSRSASGIHQQDKAHKQETKTNPTNNKQVPTEKNLTRPRRQN
ncbi:CAP-Gly domain-containing linker protein 2-like isoform X7 [Manis pentadactyla]|uniref:CAP-Gly domain-containing linker protein 2-like isoform X7 n=1 Tax=Manis pentadactyla TaxID=143292 RepID=UPI00255C574B|nr:CAP-Gly domain-containing linker protein 2-like isoform X7 [Manis pentadactyla]